MLPRKVPKRRRRPYTKSTFTVSRQERSVCMTPKDRMNCGWMAGSTSWTEDSDDVFDDAGRNAYVASLTKLLAPAARGRGLPR
jgi:hypothetical protein